MTHPLENESTDWVVLRQSLESISAAIHPSVPAMPDAFETDKRPCEIFLQKPKSEIRARKPPLTLLRSTFWGLMSL